MLFIYKYVSSCVLFYFSITNRYKYTGGQYNNISLHRNTSRSNRRHLDRNQYLKWYDCKDKAICSCVNDIWFFFLIFIVMWVTCNDICIALYSNKYESENSILWSETKYLKTTSVSKGDNTFLRNCRYGVKH